MKKVFFVLKTLCHILNKKRKLLSITNFPTISTNLRSYSARHMDMLSNYVYVRDTWWIHLRSQKTFIQITSDEKDVSKSIFSKWLCVNIACVNQPYILRACRRMRKLVLSFTRLLVLLSLLTSGNFFFNKVFHL